MANKVKYFKGNQSEEMDEFIKGKKIVALRATTTKYVVLYKENK